MTFPRTPDRARPGEAQWFWPHRQTFMERLAAQGYSRFTLRGETFNAAAVSSTLSPA